MVTRSAASSPSPPPPAPRHQDSRPPPQSPPYPLAHLAPPTPARQPRPARGSTRPPCGGSPEGFSRSCCWCCSSSPANPAPRTKTAHNDLRSHPGTLSDWSSMAAGHPCWLVFDTRPPPYSRGDLLD